MVVFPLVTLRLCSIPLLCVVTFGYGDPVDRGVCILWLVLNVCLIINLPAPSPAKLLTSTAPAPLFSRQRGSRGAPGPGQCRPRGLQGRGLAQSGKLSDVELCTSIAHCGDVEGEEDWRQVEQVVTLVKTLLLLSRASLEIHIVNNDHSFYTDIVTAVTSWEVSTAHKLRSVSSVIYLTG